MDSVPLHRWDVTLQEAVEIQHRLRARLITCDGDRRAFRTVAAMDVSYDGRSPWLFAAIVVVQLPGFELVETTSARAQAQFPYVPGLLSFRESPVGLRAWERLRTRPDCLICDGHGYAHPRRFGFACHFGLWVDLPTIGFAKNVFVGRFEPLGVKRGSVSDLVDAAPVFVSIGHRISLATAVTTILACSSGYRIPEPIRQAHALANRLCEADTEPTISGSRSG